MNQRWSLDEAGNVMSAPVSEDDLLRAQDEAMLLSQATKGNAVAMRSCWVCNSAHTHFLDGGMGKDWVLACFAGCGRYFFDGIDITVYEDDSAAGRSAREGEGE